MRVRLQSPPSNQLLPSAAVGPARERAARVLTAGSAVGLSPWGAPLFARTSVTLENNCATSGGSMFVYTPGSLSMTNNGTFHEIFWGGVVRLKNNAGIVGSVYADQLDGNKIWNNVTIRHAEPDFPPPPGVPPGEAITVTIGAWAEQEAVGL